MRYERNRFNSMGWRRHGFAWAAMGLPEGGQWAGQHGCHRHGPVAPVESEREFGPPRGPGFGSPRGPGFGHGPWGRHHEGEGRRVRPGDIRAAVLALLGERPSNGYQLIQSIAERSGGRWQASPGSIYPTLQQLEDEGLIRATEKDGRKAFELTTEGRAELSQRGDETERLWAGGAQDHAPAMALMQAISELADACRQLARAGQPKQLEEGRRLLQALKQGIYRLLAEDPRE